MKTKAKVLFLPLFLISIALWLANCNQAGPCTGSLTLENPIPDITVAVSDTVFIDLTDPPVFVSTEGRVTYAIAANLGYSYVSTDIISNPNDNNKSTLLLVFGKNQGEALVELSSFSECLENSLTFNITIAES